MCPRACKVNIELPELSLQPSFDYLTNDKTGVSVTGHDLAKAAKNSAFNPAWCAFPSQSLQDAPDIGMRL